MGDPAGVGPEVVARAVADRAVREVCRPVVAGDPDVLARASELCPVPPRVREIADVSQAVEREGELSVLPSGETARAGPGQASAEAGRASMQAVTGAIELCLGGSVAAMVTAPISKEAWQRAGYRDIGHQELLQRLSGAEEIATMLVAGALRCVHLTTHRSLREACTAVRLDNVLSRIRLTHRCFSDWGVVRPRIGVSALNPHSGEEGLMGREELDEIAPAVAAAREEGIDAQGPVPADTVFRQAISGAYDAVLAMYHDQGHIPIKVYDFERSASVNLGLPFVRTSVDHGTAFDIAWKGVADHRSLLEAARLAASLATGRGLP